MSSVPEMKVTQTVEALAFLAKHGEVTLRVDEDGDHVGPFVRTPTGNYGAKDIPEAVASALAGWIRSRVNDLGAARRILSLFGGNWTGFGHRDPWEVVLGDAPAPGVKVSVGPPSFPIGNRATYVGDVLGVRPSSTRSLNPDRHIADVNIDGHHDGGFDKTSYHVPLTPEQRTRVQEGYRVRMTIEVFK